MKFFLTLLTMMNLFLLSSAEFIQGIYSVPNTDKAFEHVKKNGFNYVHGYFCAYNGSKALETQLDLAQKHGLKVMFNLIRSGILDKPDGFEEVRKVVKKFKDHPALGGWYLFDEPTGKKQLEQLKRLYALVKKESPGIKTFLCLTQTKDWRDFTGIGDVLMGDIYPVKDEPFPEAPLHYFGNYMKQMSACGKPLVAIPQMMNWRCYPTTVMLPKETLRYPNSTELRYFAYSSLATGNTIGLFWYAYEDMRRDQNLNYLDETAGPVLKDFNALVSLLKETRGAKTFKWAEGSDFYVTLFEGKNNLKYLIVINDWPAKRRFERWNEDILGDAELTPLKSSRAVNMSSKKGKLILEGFMQPWEVLVFEVKEKRK